MALTTLLNLDIPLQILSAPGNAVGEVFALPAQCNFITWQFVPSTPPTTITVNLKLGLAFDTLITEDSTTVVGGEIKTIASNAAFVQAEFAGIAGGVGNHRVIVVAKSE